jgi:NADPH-dependent ferric siderophore reductase
MIEDMSSPIRRTPTHQVTIRAVRELTPRMRRITLGGTTLVGLRTQPAQDVELVLTEESGRRVKRRYTIRDARPEIGEIDIDALLHGHGPGSAWASTVAAGDAAVVLGPRGKLELRPADWHLFVGDESALPAFAAIIEALPDAEAAFALIEVAGPTDEVPLQRDGQLELRWIHRGGVPAGTPGLIASTLAVVRLPPGSGRAYLLGESRAVVALRPHVNQLGIADEQIFLKGYWNLGRAGRAIPG